MDYQTFINEKLWSGDVESKIGIPRVKATICEIGNNRKTFYEFIMCEEHLVDLTVPPSGQLSQRVSIYKNPTTSDLSALNKAGLNNGMVRYAAISTNKTIFILDSDKALHADLLKSLENWASVYHNDSVKGKNLDTKSDICVTGTAQWKNGELHHVSHDSWDDVAKKLISGSPITTAWANLWIPKPYQTIEQVKNDLDKLIRKFAWIENYITGFNTNNGWIKIKNFFSSQ